MENPLALLVECMRERVANIPIAAKAPALPSPPAGIFEAASSDDEKEEEEELAEAKLTLLCWLG